MKQVKYKEFNLIYDYTKYSWIITTNTGELIGSFSNIDKAKFFIDCLIING